MARPPGAFPPGFVQHYADAYRGWPVHPLHAQHAVRGAFNEPRGLAGYHFGVDVSVDDRNPEAGAPRGRSHRVHALEGGTVWMPAGCKSRPLRERKLAVGHFAYWHVDPTLPIGATVSPGEPIGWSTRGEWHVHVSEFAWIDGKRTWINPLRRGGKLAPWVDADWPIVHAIRFVRPSPVPWKPLRTLMEADQSRTLDPARLTGRVEIRVEADDPQSVLGFLKARKRWVTRHHPHRLEIEIRHVPGGHLVLKHTTFQNDLLLKGMVPFKVHFAPGTRQNLKLQSCVDNAHEICRGRYWFRALADDRSRSWNTHKVANGDYRIQVTAYDRHGHKASRAVVVTVRNG
jgi:hypothetical protein